jgi:hypothetical protein
MILDYNPLINEAGRTYSKQLLDKGWSAFDIEKSGHAWFAGSSGWQGCYGHNFQDVLESEEKQKAVLANYGLRRHYDLTQRKRGFGYDFAGRPIDYKPKLKGDLENGRFKEESLGWDFEISNPDIQHFRIAPLVAIANGSSNQVFREQAKLMITGCFLSCIGQLMQNEQELGLLIGGDRGAANIIHVGLSSILAAPEIILNHPQSQWAVDMFLQWLKQSGAAYKEYPYQVVPNQSKAGAPDGHVRLQLFNGVYWTLPELFKMFNTAIHFPAIASELSNFAHGAKGQIECCVELFTVCEEMGIKAPPFLDIPHGVRYGTQKFAGTIKPHHIPEDKNSFDLWSLAARQVAEHFSGKKLGVDRIKAEYSAADVKRWSL